MPDNDLNMLDLSQLSRDKRLDPETHGQPETAGRFAFWVLVMAFAVVGYCGIWHLLERLQ